MGFHLDTFRLLEYHVFENMGVRKQDILLHHQIFLELHFLLFRYGQESLLNLRRIRVQ